VMPLSQSGGGLRREQGEKEREQNIAKITVTLCWRADLFQAMGRKGGLFFHCMHRLMSSTIVIAYCDRERWERGEKREIGCST